MYPRFQRTLDVFTFEGTLSPGRLQLLLNHDDNIQIMGSLINYCTASCTNTQWVWYHYIIHSEVHHVVSYDSLGGGLLDNHNHLLTNQDIQSSYNIRKSYFYATFCQKFAHINVEFIEYSNQRFIAYHTGRNFWIPDLMFLHFYSCFMKYLAYHIPPAWYM